MYFFSTICDFNDSGVPTPAQLILVVVGLTKEWIEHRQFMPSLEMCAGKVHTPQLQELTILKMPKNFDLHDEDTVATYFLCTDSYLYQVL